MKAERSECKGTVKNSGAPATRGGAGKLDTNDPPSPPPVSNRKGPGGPPGFQPRGRIAWRTRMQKAPGAGAPGACALTRQYALYGALTMKVPRIPSS